MLYLDVSWSFSIEDYTNEDIRLQATALDCKQVFLNTKRIIRTKEDIRLQVLNNKCSTALDCKQVFLNYLDEDIRLLKEEGGDYYSLFLIAMFERA